jgi:hypothetical protein
MLIAAIVTSLYVIKDKAWFHHTVLSSGMGYARGAHIYSQILNHIKIQDARRVIWNKFKTEHPQALGANVKD